MIEFWGYRHADQQVESHALAAQEEDEESEGALAALCGLLGLLAIAALVAGAALITLGIAVARQLAGS